MKWYYADNGQQIGPLDEANFASLAERGTVKPETLVWREGLENWIPYSQAFPVGLVSNAAVATGDANCAECGRTFPIDEMISIDGKWICGSCKTHVVQKIKEGVALPGEFIYAGFWTRFAAKFIDGIILQIVIRLIQVALFAGMKNQGAAGGISTLMSLVIAAGFAIYFNGKYGATPGKMACKIRIVRADGEPISYGRACGRHFAEYLSAAIVFIGYIMAAFDAEKRSLHDRICDTRVVKN